MVQGINHQRDVFAHLAADIVWTFQKFRRLIDQVSGQNGIDQAIFVGFVKLLEAIGEQAEGSCSKNPPCLALL